jgi:hypothetical protein
VRLFQGTKERMQRKKRMTDVNDFEIHCTKMT